MKSHVKAHVALALFLALFATHAQAQMLKDGPPPEHRLVYNSLAIGRVNPIGGVEFLRLTYRKRLYLAQELALRDNYIGGGLSTSITPAYAKLGALVETQPLTVLRLWAQFEIAGYFSTFSMVQSLPDVRGDYSDTELRRRAALPVGDVDRNYATVGTHGTLGADIVAKFGPIAVRDFVRLTTGRLNLRGLDVAYYDLQDDVLAPNGGFALFNDTDVLYVSDFGLAAGVRFNVSHPFYDARHLSGDATAENPNGPMTRVGPVIAYTFFSEDGAMFNNPTVLLIANWWLTHRFRTGADSSQLFPYIALGFAFNGDFLPVK